MLAQIFFASLVIMLIVQSWKTELPPYGRREAAMAVAALGAIAAVGVALKAAGDPQGWSDDVAYGFAFGAAWFSAYLIDGARRRLRGRADDGVGMPVADD